MQYKVGSKVRIVSEKVGDRWDNDGQMDKWLGKVMTVKFFDGVCYRMKEDEQENMGCGWFWQPHMIEGPALELVKEDISDV